MSPFETRCIAHVPSVLIDFCRRLLLLTLNGTLEQILLLL